MKLVKFQPILSSQFEAANVQNNALELSSKVLATSKKSITPRRVPNSVGLDSDYYVSKKAPKKKIKYSQVNEEKMKKMSTTERKCYEAYLILTGNYTTV